MRAIYKNEEFFGSIRKDLNLVNIISYDERSEEEGFEETNRGYWIKRIKIEDEDLEELVEVSFYVMYKEIGEENEIWEIVHGLLELDIPRGIVVIYGKSNNKDDTWTIIERGLAAKQISLKDCTEYIIKNVYSKKAGKVVDKLEETIRVSEEEFKKAMLEYNRIEYRKQ